MSTEVSTRKVFNLSPSGPHRMTGRVRLPEAALAQAHQPAVASLYAPGLPRSVQEQEEQQTHTLHVISPSSLEYLSCAAPDSYKTLGPFLALVSRGPLRTQSSMQGIMGLVPPQPTLPSLQGTVTTFSSSCTAPPPPVAASPRCRPPAGFINSLSVYNVDYCPPSPQQGCLCPS